MGLIRQSSFSDKNRVSRNLFSSPMSSAKVISDPQKTNMEMNDRVAERFFVKRTKRSYDLSVVSKCNSMALMSSLKSASAKLGKAMKRKGFSGESNYFLGPKVPSSPEDRAKFVTPKKYTCGLCNVKLFNVSVYLKHLRKHKPSIRCSSCNCSFKNVVEKRRHELHCPKKAKFRF